MPDATISGMDSQTRQARGSDERYSAAVLVRMSEAERQQVKHLAKLAGVSMAEWMRRSWRPSVEAARAAHSEPVTATEQTQ